MRTLTLVLLLGWTSLFAAEPLHVAEARRFRIAFDTKDAGTLALLAHQPALKVPYALVLFTLLESKQFEAAEKLVALRGGAPEAANLERLLKGYRAGVVANDHARALWRKAELALNDRKPDEALALLKAAGKPPEGTITGARMEWTRAVALGMRKDWRAAVEAMSQAARLARTVGWLQQSLEVESQRLKIARQHPQNPSMQQHALFAASAVIQDAQALADKRGLLNGLLARATILASHSKVKLARRDYAAALEKARELELHAVEGRILTNLGSMAQMFERQPDRARRAYEDALAAFERAGDKESRESMRRVRLNLALALTQLGRYAAALARLDEIDRDPGKLQRTSRAQRAYILRRTGRLERSYATYAELLETAKEPRERAALSLDLGELALLRGDFRGARAYFALADAKGKARFRALSGEAAALGGLQQVSACLKKFAEAVEAAPTPEQKGRVELQWAAYERSFGHVKQALARVGAARGHLAREESTDYGNGAASWVITADLMLLDGDREQALKPLAQASVFFTRLQDTSRAIPAYSRETLVLLGFEQIGDYLDEVTKRRGTLLHLVEGTKSPALRCMGATVDGVFLHRRGTPEEGNKRFAEAIRIAREADLPDREAAALATQALFAGAAGVEPALRALALRERRPEWSIELHPMIAGERGDPAPSIALRALLQRETPDGELALDLVERVKADRMELALRGRDAILIRMLSDDDYGSYIDKRGALREARVTGVGADDAQNAFVAEMARLREFAPLAFPRIPMLTDVQAALRDDELLLLYVDDAYARGVLAIDRSRAVLSRFDPAKPLDGLGALLENKQRLLVSPGGFLAFDAARWKEGIVADAFSLQYCSSAMSVIAQRTRRVPTDRSTMRDVEQTTTIGLQHPQASDADLSPNERARVVVYGKTAPKGVAGASADGIACIAEARLRAGADFVLIDFLGNANARVLARFRMELAKEGAAAPEALRLARTWAREQTDLRDPRHWATLVLWGAP